MQKNRLQDWMKNDWDHAAELVVLRNVFQNGIIAILSCNAHMHNVE